METNKRLYKLKVPIIGVTGGIASGKSTLLNYLAKKGYCTISADKLVKNIYQKKETINFVKCLGVVNKNKINFKKLRQLVFTDEKIRQKLENFIYKHLPSEFKKNIRKDSSLIFYELPLLFEKKLDKNFDAILVVLAPPKIRLKRLSKKISIDMAKKIMQLQLSHTKKIKNCYYILNNSSKDSFLRKTDKALKMILRLGILDPN